ncbi:hypothetical protein AcV7_008191 [Taiwanofungus camphoratus]|nr:hypothetical protein AcV7_008191 [Antrodia cinnamomea]
MRELRIVSRPLKLENLRSHPRGAHVPQLLWQPGFTTPLIISRLPPVGSRRQLQGVQVSTRPHLTYFIKVPQVCYLHRHTLRIVIYLSRDKVSNVHGYIV